MIHASKKFAQAVEACGMKVQNVRRKMAPNCNGLRSATSLKGLQVAVRAVRRPLKRLVGARTCYARCANTDGVGSVEWTLTIQCIRVLKCFAK